MVVWQLFELKDMTPGGLIDNLEEDQGDKATQEALNSMFH